MPSPKHIHEESDAFTSDFCNNHSHPASPASLYLTSPRPRPTRPRVPYLMSSSPSSRVPKSQVPTHASRCPHPLVPVPLLYTATFAKRNCSSKDNLNMWTQTCNQEYKPDYTLKIPVRGVETNDKQDRISRPQKKNNSEEGSDGLNLVPVPHFIFSEGRG